MRAKKFADFLWHPLYSKAIMTSNKPKISKNNEFSPLSIPREAVRLYRGAVEKASVSLASGLFSAFKEERRVWTWSDYKVFGIIGEALLQVIDSWGPLYGKGMQVWFSRLGERGQGLVNKLGLDRIYGDWPTMPWADTETILNREIPGWQESLTIEREPLGVASLSQVHGATDANNKKLVIKILKPHSVKRLYESVQTIETALKLAEPFAVTRFSKRFILDVRDLCRHLRRETDLTLESANIDRVSKLLLQAQSKMLKVPEVWDEFSTKNVIVMERLEGVKLSDIVNGKVDVSSIVRKNLAKSLLSELLVQIFEWGVFHADPHAGNLMFLEDGSIGLYDWGMAGELQDNDRRYIVGILRAVLTLNLEKLVDVLQIMSKETRGVELERSLIKQELRDFQNLIETKKDKLGLSSMIEEALKAADRLEIDLPSGLLMMAKSLMTIEGLARGLDQEIGIGKIAGPVLFKASKPGLAEFVGMARSLPKLAKKWFMQT